MDIGCAVIILLLGVVNEGLGAGYAGFPPEGLQELHKLHNIPDEITPVGVIPIGHRAPDIPSPSLKRGRKADMEYIHREGW